jgi:hypothetical protein
VGNLVTRAPVIEQWGIVTRGPNGGAMGNIVTRGPVVKQWGILLQENQ